MTKLFASILLLGLGLGPTSALADEDNPAYWVSCRGTNYTYEGVTQPRVAYLSEALWKTKYNHEEDKRNILKFYSDRWTKNKPADTWSCKLLETNAEFVADNTLYAREYRLFPEPERIFYPGEYSFVMRSRTKAKK